MPKLMAGMCVFSPALRLVALAVVALAAAGAALAGELVPDARDALRQIERQVADDLTRHVAWLPYPHKLEATLAEDGLLRVYLEVRTRELRLAADAEELAKLASRKLSEHLAARWPRLTLARDSRLVVKRPFSFTEELPDYAAPLSVAKPQRRLVVRPAPLPARGRAGALHGAAPVSGPTRGETDLRVRIARVFGRRWVVKQLAVSIPAPQRAKVWMRLDVVSQGDARDRERLKRAITDLEQVMKLGSYAPAGGSELRFDVFEGEAAGGSDAPASAGGTGGVAGAPPAARPALRAGSGQRGRQVGKLVATYGDGWTITGEVPAAVSTGPPPSIASPPRPEKKPPIRASVPDRHVRRAKHPPPPPEPDPEKSGPHRPVSTEDLVEVPGSIVGRRGQAKARARVLLRRIKAGTYAGVGEVDTVQESTSISIVTARRFQTTFAYAHLDQTDAAGDSLVFSLKYQTPPALKRNAHVALGTDILLQSRRDQALRLPDDYEQADSFWATYNLWTSPISLVHLMVKRVGTFRLAREFTQLGVAQELLAHHPFRRAYWELVYDDRGGRAFPVVGLARSPGFAANVGAELSLGRRSGLIVNVPHLFDDHYREANITLFTRL